MKILIATDGSEYGKSAVETAAQHIWPIGSELKVVSVVDPPVPIGGEIYMMNMNIYEETARVQREEAQKIIDDAAAAIHRGVNGDNVRVSMAVLTGSPNRRTVEEADEWGADLIMLGSHGYKTWERVLLGSVSLSVAQHAKCSVWIVRPLQKQ
jgi:nucleotide-binding universal stress UspA family protein